MEGLRHLSTTMVGNYPVCPSRAWNSYLKRLEFGDDNEGTDATRFGTIVHAVQEEIHNRKMVDENFHYTDGNVMEVFDRLWQEGTCVDFEIYAFGRDKIADFIRKGITNRLGETVGVEIMFVYECETNKVWLVDDIPHRNRIVDQVLARGNTPVSSEIDRWDRYVDPEGKIHIKVYDYKTNILPFTRDEIENSRQLGLYRLVAGVVFPEAESIECIYDMLRHGRFPVTFPEVFLTDLRQYFINLWKQITAAEKPEEKINKYCRWCEIRGNCKAYAAALASDIPPILTDTTDTPEALSALYDQYTELGDLVKLANQRRDEIKIALSAKIVKDNLGEPLEVGKDEYYLQQNPRYEYNKKAVFDVMGENGCTILLPDMVTVSKTSVERVLRTRPEVRQQLETHMKKTFVTPTLKRRRKDGGTMKGEESTDE